METLMRIKISLLSLHLGSACLKPYLIIEYQRLKEHENDQYNLEWNAKRILSKINYHIQTDAVKNHIIPTSKYNSNSEWIAYAEEADILNVALYEMQFIGFWVSILSVVASGVFFIRVYLEGFTFSY